MPDYIIGTYIIFNKNRQKGQQGRKTIEICIPCATILNQLLNK
jgi:hypothetical protein